MPGRENERYSAIVRDRLRNDHIFLNNPVIMQGLALAPIVVAATTMQNAVVLSVAILLLLTPTRVLSVLLLHLTGNQYRVPIYALSAAGLYIPVYLMLNEFFSTNLLALGIYLPLLVVDPLLIHRSERTHLESPTAALKHGFNMTVGACLITLLMGGARELLALGTLYGNTVCRAGLFPIASMPSGGFILLGLLCAVWRGFVARYRKRLEEVRL